ncbi:hypothetical protein HNY73_014216 [Argiope bruennichi]|uniref:Uncharacterized protein n=1 Tax=Argiope bruennichi TaxID=94029 RepID=A0A8T0ESC9_ARGBR|nr:hypothetical protein HNY73_014216 [Argiope bruennichi]
MKVLLFLCAITLVVTLASTENDSAPDESRLQFYKKFEQQHGIDTHCKGNHTFYQYGDCDMRCDFMPEPDCYGAKFISCLACKKGYIPVDKKRTKCVKPEDCP